jgi:large subunit ribosomal protein L25
MELKVTGRTSGKKSEIKKIRREGNIPAVIYSKGMPGENLIIEGIEFQKLLNQIERGTLSTKILTLNNGSKNQKVILKDIQYDIVTYNVIHLDFAELHDDVPVKVKVPIRLVGAMDCVGVKLGGVLNPKVRFLLVSCLPKDIPSHFELDVRDLGLNQGLKLGNIFFSDRIRPLVDLNQAAVVVTKR